MIACAECGRLCTGSPDGWTEIKVAVTDLGKKQQGSEKVEYFCPACAKVAKDLIGESNDERARRA